MKQQAASLVILLALCMAAPVNAGDSDPLPSWNAGASKASIMDFVNRVTAEGGPDFMPPPQRIATFDNDGTLWSEQPMYFQVIFALDRVKPMAPDHPEWAESSPALEAAMTGDVESVLAMGEKGLVEIVAASHSGMT